MADSTRSSIVVDAPAGDVLDIIADLEAYPEWITEFSSVEILTEDGDGWPDQARFGLDAGPIKDTYTLKYVWEVGEDGQGVASWNLVDATVLKAMDGSYTLASTPDGGTEVVYELTVDVRVPMLGMLKRKAEKVIVDSALRDLKKRAEA
ncbi:SRPBCC family protein [Janibacter sp. DB-40]|uniref:SRPBCC family protein n=1 Tax=Janibacter sp. DB-40 TaxID=3028808 RepID=UPI0024070575|nr:SRPBCC family protein [Janibacter sp. DB-40]